MLVDFQILDFIQRYMKSDVGDAVMLFITSLADRGLIWIALAIILILIPKTRKVGMMVAFALVLDALLCNLVAKPLFARVRPYDIRSDIEMIVRKPRDFSFPSGHTAASFAAAAALYFAHLDWKWIWKAAAVLAVAIAFSRLYLYVHYPTDVLGGALLGILCGWLGVVFVNQLFEKGIPRMANTDN